MAPSTRTHLWETVLSGKWQNLGDLSLQDTVESAYSSGSDGYQYKARGYTYDIDFGRMKQVNVTTKRERNLRRVPDPRASSVAASAVTPASAGVHVPSTKLYHAPTAGRVYTGPTTTVPKTSGGHPTRATKAGSIVLHPGHPGVVPAPAVSPVPTLVPKVKAASVAASTASPATTVARKKTAPPSAASKAAPAATAKASPAATAWTKSAKTAPVAAAPVSVAPPPAAPVAPPPVAPAKKPLPHKGKVKLFVKEKGYGFIALDDGQEVFFHLTSVSELLDGSIRANDTVEIALAKGSKPRALQVRVKARGSIFKQMCTNKCCRDKGDRHFEDRCPLKRKRGGADSDNASVSTACS